MSLRDLFVGITFNDKASKQIDRVDKSMDSAADGASELGSNATTAEKKVGLLGTTAGKVAGLIAGAFAIDKIKDFGISMVESAATAQATSAQFSQVFGADAGEARGVVENLGESFGMVSERIKPAYTQMTSMFKGLGLETGEAMDEASRAVTLAADAAAFYDKSYEDANGALNSFIKGNYEGGESIGLFANETQLASWASKNLGLDWKKLGEADKQMARLKFAESMQKAAGATGQAKRESDSYENQLGNLKQTWTNLKAQLATPVLGTVVAGLKGLANWLGNINTEQIINGFKTFGSYMSDTFKPVFSDIKTIVLGLWDTFANSGGLETAKGALDGFKSGLQWLRDNSSVISAGLLGLVGAFAAFKMLSFINTAIGVFNTLMIAFRTGTVMATLAQWGLNTAMLASPLTWIAVGIGLVIAAGVLLYKNWDLVKTKAGELWNKTKEVFGNIFNWASQKIQPVVNFFKNLADKFRDFKNAITSFKMPKWVSSIGSTLSSAASKVGNLLPGHATGLASVPYDNYAARLHKDEAVLTARQSTALRDAGILKSNADGTPTLDMQATNNPSIVNQSSGGYSGAPSLTIESIVIQGTGDTESDVKEAVRRAWNEMWESFARTNPQVTER